MTNVPELRFAGFDGEWKESVLDKNLISLKSGLSRKLSDYDIGIPVVRANNTYDNRLDLKKNIKYWYDDDPQGADTNNYVIEKNDILINFINSMSKMGTAALVRENPERKTIYTTNIMRLKTNKSLNPFFYLMLTLTVNYRKYIESISMQAVNQSSFTTKDYKRYKFYKPSYNEQEKIGSLFSKIDQLIEGQQEIVDQTMALKKSMLQKMFPSNSSPIPQLRFNLKDYGFDNGILNDFIVTHGSKNYITNPCKEGKFKVIQQGDIPIAGYSNNLPYEDYKNVILFGDHTLSLYKPTSPFLLATDGIKIIFVENINTYYFYYLIQSIMPESQGYKRHYKILRGTKVKIVKSAEEQEKIGNFFKNLDEKIAKEEKLLELYKDMKKSLLQKMFV